MNDDVNDNGQSWFANLLERLQATLRPWLWPAIGLSFAVLFTLVVIQPFGKSPSPGPDNVATAWIESIGRLGILPVYPPAEDIRVGDVWGVVADAEDTLLLNKAVRLAHIDLREDIVADAQGPVFPDTAELAQGQTFRHQETQEKSAGKIDRIAPSLAAFPGIVISHNRHASGSAGLGFGIFGGNRDDEDTEEIRIPAAETYGAPVVAAFAKLNDFCTKSQTTLYCQDDFVRRSIAYATDARVLATIDGRYRAKLQLSFIVRTYATREIVQKRVRKDSRGGQVAASANVVSVSAPGAPEDNAGDKRAGPAPVAKADSQGSAAINMLRGDETQVALQQVFERPVVFGYRAITISLPPSTPRQGVSR